MLAKFSRLQAYIVPNEIVIAGIFGLYLDRYCGHNRCPGSESYYLAVTFIRCQQDQISFTDFKSPTSRCHQQNCHLFLNGGRNALITATVLLSVLFKTAGFITGLDRTFGTLER